MLCFSSRMESGSVFLTVGSNFLDGWIQITFFSRLSDLDPGRLHPDPQLWLNIMYLLTLSLYTCIRLARRGKPDWIKDLNKSSDAETEPSLLKDLELIDFGVRENTPEPDPKYSLIFIFWYKFYMIKNCRRFFFDPAAEQYCGSEIQSCGHG